MADPIERYLSRYAEPEARQLHGRLGHYRCAIVVPVFAEAPTWLSNLLRRKQPEDCLVIAVINVPDHLAPTDPRVAATSRLLQLNHAACLVVDRVTHPLPRRQGVGLARKIGNDIALALYANKQLSSPWIYQTDADAQLPEQYFTRAMPQRGAVVFAHRHCSSDPVLQRAAALYDAHMRYYVEGLARAGSRYAHKSLGSTIAVHAKDYATVRGFPKRNAGEDFYLLNKLAKVSAVTAIDDVVIELQARLSNRVPFGTGPALTALVEQLQRDSSGATYCSYHPASFQLLAQAIRLLNEFAATSQLPPHPATTLIEGLGLAKVSANILQRYSKLERRQEALTDWFDGLKTLRFIHAARRFYPDQPLLMSVPDALIGS